MKYMAIVINKDISKTFFVFLIILTLLNLNNSNLILAASSESTLDQKLEALVQAEEVFNNAELQGDGSYNIEISGLGSIVSFFSRFPIPSNMPHLQVDAARQFWNAKRYPYKEIETLYKSLEHFSMSLNANHRQSNLRLVLKTTTEGHLDLMRSTFTSSFRHINQGIPGEVKYSFHDIFANKMHLRSVPHEYSPILRNMRLAIMNAFPSDFQDFVNGRAIDSTVKQAVLGLRTNGQRRKFLNEIIGDINEMIDDMAQEVSANQGAVREAADLSGFSDETAQALSTVREEFAPLRNAITKRDINEFASNVGRHFNKAFNNFTYDDFKKSLFDGPLARSLNEFRTTLTGLVSARYMVAGGAVIGGMTYFTSTLEASEVEGTEDDEDITESNVHIYISMTVEELQAQKDRIASDRQLLLYEQNRNTQRNSRRPWLLRLNIYSRYGSI